MRKILLTLWSLAVIAPLRSQTYWNPDSTGFNYLSRGKSLQSWVATVGTTLEVDPVSYRAGGSSIKWTIPPNSGTAFLDLKLTDLDLRGRVVYTVCRRNNHAADVVAKIMVGPSRGFRLPDPVYYNTAGRHLPVDAWHQRGRYTSTTAIGGALPEELAHVKSIRFQADNAEVEQILWIAEVRYARPRGPACIINFNNYRDTADSLLTPWLLANGYRANIDFTFEESRDQVRENRGGAGLITRYIGLDRIAALVQQYGWSTTHHGVFYKYLNTLTPEERLQLYALEPFQQAGFEAQWCFSIPHDETTPEIYAEIQGLNRFYSVRTQGVGKPPNELPIDEPIQLRFYRPTSASAAPNPGGSPQTLAQMRAEAGAYYDKKGLLILDFGSIVTTPLASFTGSEITMLSEAQALIQYADSLGFQFITFKDLFAPDPGYKTGVSINPDYVTAVRNRTNVLPLLQNDLSFSNDSLRVLAVATPQHGQALVSQDHKDVSYTPASGFTGEDRFYYVATNGTLVDTAWVFVAVANSLDVGHNGPPAIFTLQHNYPNPFGESTTLSYELLQPAFVEIKVFASTGQEVATLVEENQLPGPHRAAFVAEKLAAGIYFYRTRINGSAVAVQKMVYLGTRK